MHRLAHTLIALLGLAAGTLAVAWAEVPAAPPVKPAADEAAIKKLIADLGAKDAATRNAAQKRLIEIGFASRPALLVAAKSDDPEVESAATRLTRALPRWPWTSPALGGPGHRATSSRR